MPAPAVRVSLVVFGVSVTMLVVVVVVSMVVVVMMMMVMTVIVAVALMVVSLLAELSDLTANLRLRSIFHSARVLLPLGRFRPVAVVLAGGWCSVRTGSCILGRLYHDD